MPTITPKCIITGCQLSVSEAFTQHGDLWELGDTYIFNAVGAPNYELSFTSDKEVIVRESNHNNYFERRNVYVFAKSEAELNGKAQAYIARSAR